MARDALSKDELKHDPLQDWFFHAVDYVHKRQRRFIAGGIAAVIVIASGVGYVMYSRIHARNMAAAFNAAEALMMETNAPPDQRIAKSREAFQAFLDDYGSASLAPYAWMHLAGLAASEGKTDEAETDYRAVIDNADAPASLRAIARTSLGKLYEDHGELDKSAQLYQALQGEPYGDLAEFSLARVALAENKADQARKHLENVEQNYPQSILASLARDVLFFVH